MRAQFQWLPRQRRIEHAVNCPCLDCPIPPLKQQKAGAGRLRPLKFHASSRNYSRILRRKTPTSAKAPEPNNTMLPGSGTGSAIQLPENAAPFGSLVKSMLIKNGSPLVNRSPPLCAMKVTEVSLFDKVATHGWL